MRMSTELDAILSGRVDGEGYARWDAGTRPHPDRVTAAVLDEPGLQRSNSWEFSELAAALVEGLVPVLEDIVRSSPTGFERVATAWVAQFMDSSKFPLAQLVDSARGFGWGNIEVSARIDKLARAVRQQVEPRLVEAIVGMCSGDGRMLVSSSWLSVRGLRLGSADVERMRRQSPINRRVQPSDLRRPGRGDALRQRRFFAVVGRDAGRTRRWWRAGCGRRVRRRRTGRGRRRRAR